MNDDFGGNIPADDWGTYAEVRNLPLYLWRQLREAIEAEEESKRRAGAESFRIDIDHATPRVEFSLLDSRMSLDPRLVARLYRGWWARVLFTSEMGVPLRHFVRQATGKWPNRTAKGASRQLPSLHLDGTNSRNPAYVSVGRLYQSAPGGGVQRDSYRRFQALWANGRIVVEQLQRIEEKSIDRLIEYGDVPLAFPSMLAAMVFAYIRDPERQRGVLTLLDDVFLPDFTDVSKARSEYDDGRLHFVRRTDHEKSKSLSAKRSKRDAN